MLQMVIVDARFGFYKETLEKRFPGKIQVHVPPNESAALQFAPEAEVLACFPDLSDAFVQRAPKLKWVQALTTGVDHVLAYPSLSKSALITSTKGIHGPQMSEMAILHMLSLNRKLPANIKNQEKHVWERWPTRLLWKKKVAIVGLGTSGQALAKCCRAFGMEVHAVVQTPRPIPEVDFVHSVADLPKAAALADYLVVFAPLTEKSRGLINEKVFSAMKPDAFFINLARGPLADEAALLRVLQEKRIAGAGLDVFCTEPLPADSPFWDLDNVLITPHIAGMSDIYPQQALPVVEENVGHYLEGTYHLMRNLAR